jgi:hypothetical protein
MRTDSARVARHRRGRCLIAVGVLVLAMVACTNRPNPGGPTTTTPGGGGGPVQTRTIRYGPLPVPGKNQPAIGPFALVAPFIGGQAGTGTAWNVPRTNIQKPCQDCYITGISADLKKENGETANVHNGLWLHHMVLLTANPNGSRQDATCRAGLQQVAVGAIGGAERFWASGNERTKVDMSGANGNYGYKLNASDRVHMIYELMNDNVERMNVYIELTYKFVAGSTPGMRNIKPVWLDANGCGVSEVPARTGQYQINTGTWVSNVSGPILGTGGHAHDGATNVLIKKNGQPICDSVATYGGSPEFIPPGGGMDHGDHGMDHGGGEHGAHTAASISQFSQCFNAGQANVGDRFQATAFYDDSKHPQMVHGGRLHTVMAIALVYIGQ